MSMERNSLIVPQGMVDTPTQPAVLPRLNGVSNDSNSDDSDCEEVSETESQCNICQLVQGMCFMKNQTSLTVKGARNKMQRRLTFDKCN